MGCAWLWIVSAGTRALEPTQARGGGAYMSDWLLALHSSTETLGIALVGAQAPMQEARVVCRSLGRALTNELVISLQQVLPSDQWTDIKRLAVATGPGGFTGTRLTVVLARTLAQQLGVPLHGVSSFALMAPRLRKHLPETQQQEPFSIVQTLPRRGQVAGRYRIAKTGVEELESPRLLTEREQPSPAIPMDVDVAADVLELLRCCQNCHVRDHPGPWDPVLPIYPTSPVGPV